jgi:predicted metal-dependent peptidase
MNPRDKLAAGRLMAGEKMPYFRAALWAMIPHEARGLGTFGVTEAGVLLWDPEKATQWSVEEVAETLIHETGHLLRDHAKRCKQMGADPGRWNCAADAEINDDLKAAGMLKQGEWVLPQSFGGEDGKLAEEYYHLIRSQQQGKGGGKGKEGGKSEGKGKDGSGFAPPEKPQVGAGWCGSGAGRPVPGEPDTEVTQGRSEADIARVRRQVAEEIRKETERGRGTVPAGWARWADAHLQPAVIPWQHKLARYARHAMAERAGMTDYSYKRPSRRQAGMGWGPGSPILPIMRGNKPDVLAVVDTSGSMGDAEMHEALVEVNGIMKGVGGEIRFMSCDAMVHATGQVSNIAQVRRLLKGGGGTDFRPVFSAALKMPKKPSVLVFLTDGCGPAPACAPPGISTIWVLIGPYQQRPAAWGEYVEVPHKPKPERMAARR